jgi:hypothetical protein
MMNKFSLVKSSPLLVGSAVILIENAKMDMKWVVAYYLGIHPPYSRPHTHKVNRQAMHKDKRNMDCCQYPLNGVRVVGDLHDAMCATTTVMRWASRSKTWR